LLELVLNRSALFGPDFFREGINNPSDGFRGGFTVDGSEHEVSGCSGVAGGFEGGEVAQFADEDDVGILAKGAL
jgi:hypothetical protein